MLLTVLDVLLAGLLLGGIYALISMGLSLQYGVARVFNVAHGEFIMIGAMITWTLYTFLHLNPLISAVICGPCIFVIGFFLHRTLFKELKNKSPSTGVFESNSMLAAFGLMFVIQNIVLLIPGWGSEIRAYTYMASPVNIAGTIFAANRLLTLFVAALIGIAFYIFLVRTRLGKAIRAAAQDAVTARLMGVNINVVLAICFGFGALLATVAGVLISMCYPVHATMGMEYTVIAMIVVVLGGLGSIPGSFLGGFILGLVGSIVTYFQPGLALVAYYLIFMFLLLVRPSGILGK
ncbi:MAG: branched-chain amino acid ABC transporter permease [Dehalococcoidales bacterium]|nr:branched-chain amino acid ABC transporter permease [Dehalococcoidales bacterium]